MKRNSSSPITHTRRVCSEVRVETGYRSGLEVKVAAGLDKAGATYRYETMKLPYTETHIYIPDFILPEQAIVIEAKGFFDSADRGKLLKIKAAYPGLDIRLIFNNPNARLRKGAKTTYADWCDSRGFIYAKDSVPAQWLAHKPEERSILAFREATTARLALEFMRGKV